MILFQAHDTFVHELYTVPLVWTQFLCNDRWTLDIVFGVKFAGSGSDHCHTFQNAIFIGTFLHNAVCVCVCAFPRARQKQEKDAKMYGTGKG